MKLNEYYVCDTDGYIVEKVNANTLLNVTQPDGSSCWTLKNVNGTEVCRSLVAHAGSAPVGRCGVAACLNGDASRFDNLGCLPVARRPYVAQCYSGLKRQGATESGGGSVRHDEVIYLKGNDRLIC